MAEKAQGRRVEEEKNKGELI